MQLVWLCVYIHTSFEDTFENSLWGILSKCNLCDNASSQATHLRRHLKLHSGKIPDVTSVALHSLRQAIWGDIWKHTVEKSRINVNSVAFHPLRQAIWRDIWKHSAEKSNKCNKCDFALAPADNLRIHDIMNSEIAWEALHYITLVTSNFSA